MVKLFLVQNKMANFKKEKYSILMSVYSKDKPEFLIQAIDSMLNQTVKSNDFVIVKDGELTKELDNVLNSYSKKNKSIKIVELEQNSGLGKALDYGLSFCKNELVARMDADDISLPERCEKLLKLFKDNPNLSIAGTNVDEFIDDPTNPVSSRVVPTIDKEIKKYIRRRSPFNHPTVMFKKSEVIRCGGYGPLKRKQDMDLFSRMLNMGCIAENIPESLLLFRADADNLKRRQSKEYRKSTVTVAKLNLKRKYINIFDYLYIVVGQFLMRFLPKRLLNKLLRDDVKTGKNEKKSNYILTTIILTITTTFIFLVAFFGISNSSLCSIEKWSHALKSECGSNIHVRYYLKDASEGKRKSIIDPVNSFNSYRIKELGRSVSFVNDNAFTVSLGDCVLNAQDIVYGDYFNQRFTTSRLLLLSGKFDEIEFPKGDTVYLSQSLYDELAEISHLHLIGKKVSFSFEPEKEFVIGGSVSFNGLNDTGVHVRHFFSGSFIVMASSNLYNYDFTDLLFGSDDYHFADDLADFENKIKASYLDYQKVNMRYGSIVGTDLLMSKEFLLDDLVETKDVLISVGSIVAIVLSLLVELLFFIDYRPTKNLLISTIVFVVSNLILGFSPIAIGLIFMKNGTFLCRISIGIIIAHAAEYLFFGIIKTPLFNKATNEVKDEQNG